MMMTRIINGVVTVVVAKKIYGPVAFPGFGQL
jgi:hypothetical protein